MTPKPIGGATGPGANSQWVAAVVLGVLGLLLVAGLATGVIRHKPQRARRSAGRVAISLDATFAPRDRQDSLEYLLDDQHKVVMEQQRGDGDPEEETSPVVFEYPDEIDCEPTEPV
jgi:hypothetical protein